MTTGLILPFREIRARRFKSMRNDNLAALDDMTLAELERELDGHTREIVEPDKWMRFNWSVSRHQTFETCKRQYYLNYYGARRVREAKSKAVSAIWWLKQVRPLKTWLGTVIHYAARLAVQAHKDGHPIPSQKLVDEAVKYYRGGVRASERGAKHDNQWVVLFEHIYPSDADSVDRDRAETRVVTMTRTLLESDAYRLIRSQPPETILEIDEDFQSFELEGIVTPGTLTVFAIPDVLLRLDDHYYLIDWKTGDIDREGIRVQAGVYRLYVQHEYRALENLIHATIADLGGRGESVDPPGRAQSVSEAHSFIRHSAGAMLAHLENKAYNTAAIKDFPMTHDLTICRTCGFKRACWR
jgi:PD-(D/E)XK nuclease superfamily